MERIKSFETRREAMKYVALLNDAVYYLSHGEAGRPSYVEYNFYYGTFNAKKNGFLAKEDWEV